MSIFSNRASDARREAGAYTEAVLGLLGNRDPMAVLRSLGGELRRRTAGLGADVLARPEASGKWSIVAVVRHLLDSEWVWGYRLRRIVAEDRPPIDGYDQDLWADRLRYAEEHFEPALGELEALRAANLRFLESLDANESSRAGVHSERGAESVEHLVRMYAGHDLLHLKQIERIRRAVAG